MFDQRSASDSEGSGDSADHSSTDPSEAFGELFAYPDGHGSGSEADREYGVASPETRAEAQSARGPLPSFPPEEIPERLNIILGRRYDLVRRLKLWDIPFETVRTRVRTLLARELSTEGRTPETIARRRTLAQLVVPEAAVAELIQEAHCDMVRRLDVLLGPAREAHAAAQRAEMERKVQREREQRHREQQEREAAGVVVTSRACGTQHRADPQRDAQILQRYDGGQDATAIASAVGCHRSHVFAVLRRAGRETRRAISEADRAKVISMRAEGVPVAAIAKAVGRSLAATYAVLSTTSCTAGIAPRSTRRTTARPQAPR
jgi:Mor family transcriptional regulator